VPRQHAVPIAIARQFSISYGSQSSGLNNLTQGINAKVFRPSNHVDNLIMSNTSLCEKHKVVLQGHKLVWRRLNTRSCVKIQHKCFKSVFSVYDRPYSTIVLAYYRFYSLTIVYSSVGSLYYSIL
jgi:hypothetical protein